MLNKNSDMLTCYQTNKMIQILSIGSIWIQAIKLGTLHWVYKSSKKRIIEEKREKLRDWNKADQ